MKPSRLALKISLYAFAVSILWTILGAGTLLFLDYQKSKNDVIDKIQTVSETHSAGMSQSLWNYDAVLLETQLKALVHLPSISFGQVKGAGGKIWQSGQKKSEKLEVLSFPLDYSDRGKMTMLGTLEIIPDFQPLHDNVLSLVLKTITTQAINTIAIVCAFLILFYTLAGRHLAEIASQASALNADNLDQPIFLNRKSRNKGKGKGDELDILKKALNDMRTNLIKAFSAIRISEARHRKLFETMHQGVIYQDSTGKILSANPSALNILGIDKNKILTRSSYDPQWDFIREDESLLPADQHPAIIALATGQPVMDSILGVRNATTNEYRWLRSNSTPLFKENKDTPYQVHTIFEDITQRRKERETLERYAHIISSTNDMMYFVDEKCTYQAVNESYLEFHCKNREDLIGIPVSEVFGQDNYDQIAKQRFDQALNNQKNNFRSWLTYPKAGKRYMDITLTPFIDLRGNVGGVVVTAHDLTELKEAEEALRSSEEKFRNLVENLNDVIYAIDNNGALTYISPRIKMLLDIDPMAISNLNFIDLIYKEDIAKAKTHIHNALAGNPSPSEFRIREQSGEVRWLRSSPHPIRKDNSILGLRGILTDITEQKQLEAQLLQAQKMDAIGQLAGGIAHDFNNMLAGIIGASEILSLNIKNEKLARKYTSIIIEASERAAGLTNKLLTFSRSSPKDSSKLDIHQIINDTVVLLKNSIDRRIELITDLRAEISTVIGDPSQLQNVFLNLGINSSHAIKEGGKITFSSHVRELDRVFCEASPFNLEPGPYLSVEVADTGVGIPLAHQQKIFEPFFTTKEQGKGTGLGLAAAYGAIRQHQGSITVYSEQGTGTGTGTLFHILLPLANGEIIPGGSQSQRITGTGRILLVDDEEYMRLTAHAILEDLGYSVETAKDGQEAVDKYRSEPIPFDLIILDMVMPVKNGRDCFNELIQINPDVRVVLSSGFTQEEDLEDMKRRGLKGFISKPYRSVALSKVIYNALQ